MENMDNKPEDARININHDDDDLMLEHVVQDDHELMYLDVCLNEICRLKQETGS